MAPFAPTNHQADCPSDERKTEGRLAVRKARVRTPYPRSCKVLSNGKTTSDSEDQRRDAERVAASAQAPGSEMCSNEIREPRYRSPRPAPQINYALLKNLSLPPPAYVPGGERCRPSDVGCLDALAI